MSFAESTPKTSVKSVSIKVAHQGALYRFSCEPAMAALNAALCVVLQSRGPFALSYRDTDGDEINFSSQVELDEALRVGLVNNVLRVTALSLSSSSPAPPSAAPQERSPNAAPNPPLDDAAFWASLPAWLQEKIVRRHREQHSAPASELLLPASDPACFAALDDDAKLRLRAKAAHFAARRRERLESNREHHQVVSDKLERKALKYLAKAEHERQRAALKAAKLDEQFGADNKRADSDDAQLWAQVPLHVKQRIVGRWLGDRALKDGQAESAGVELFRQLPAHVQERVRRRAHAVAAAVAADAPSTSHFATPAFQMAPRATALPTPQL